mgnify:FL=1
MPIWWRTPPSVVAAAACLTISACSSLPPSPYSDGVDALDLAPGIEDRQPRFREIFCTILEERGTDLPDVRPCEEALTRVNPVPADTGGDV